MGFNFIEQLCLNQQEYYSLTRLESTNSSGITYRSWKWIWVISLDAASSWVSFCCRIGWTKACWDNRMEISSIRWWLIPFPLIYMTKCGSEINSKSFIALLDGIHKLRLWGFAIAPWIKQELHFLLIIDPACFKASSLLKSFFYSNLFPSMQLAKFFIRFSFSRGD